jgi:hypothetical protein
MRSKHKIAAYPLTGWKPVLRIKSGLSKVQHKMRIGAFGAIFSIFLIIDAGATG